MPSLGRRQSAQQTPPLHTLGLSHILLQVSLHYEDIDGEYRGGRVVEEENESGGASM